MSKEGRITPIVRSDGKYDCAACGLTFEKGWTEDEAVAESTSNFPGTPAEDMAIVCDDCYKSIMEPPEEAPILAKLDVIIISMRDGAHCVTEIEGPTKWTNKTQTK